ncbi:MAG: bifunctional diguanylate cyclase/phosphodiesterase [Candidatus Eisenbacteria bacterium]|nr:bifunctional diguanylate cyclase/phosphodiesterase [Candidatus Eisenbacteria bacterium]
MKGCLRITDTIARLGGDEFMIILQDVKKVEDITAVVEKLFSILSEPFNIQGHEFFVTTSVRISVFPDDGEDAEALLRNADIAMYRAKDEGIGNNYVLFISSMNERTHERLKMESMLRRALERGEFLLHYQPQIALNSREVTGIEALVRWQEPERGLIPPGEFIPVAEEIGIIISLGEWILRNACMTNKKWRDKGLKPVSIAVNLSLRQFKQKNFVDTVARILKEIRLDPHCLEMELTESILMENAEATIDILRALKEVGIRMTIDDFGTGYSSLEYLRRMPIDMLKIALPFVRDITKSPGDASIVTAIINMAHSLNIEVIAEGVETVEQLALLRSLGCDKIQGFLVSRPVPPDELEEFLEKGSRFVIQ